MIIRILLLIILTYHIDVAYSINEACQILGEAIAAPLEQLELKNSHKQNHYFKSPYNEHMYLGVPSKTGNRHWSALFYKLMYEHAPNNNHDLSGHTKFYKDCRHDKKEPFSKKDNIWLIVRNPYIRFLSTYLDKMTKERDNYGTWLQKMRYASFKDTIEEMLRIILEGLPDHLAWTLSPYERARRACFVDHHFCMQSAYLHIKNDFPPAIPIRLLHAEYQLYWYSTFLECFDINLKQVIGDEWTPYNGKPCFYSPKPDCDISTYSIMSNTANETAILAAMAGSETSSHSTGSALKVYDYYTKELALNVSYILEYDLRMLGYPVWDGVSELPLPKLN